MCDFKIFINSFKKSLAFFALCTIFIAGVFLFTSGFTGNAVESLAGDVTGDGNINMADVVALRRYLVNGDKYPLTVEAVGDVTADGQINMADVVAIRRFLVNSEVYPLMGNTATEAPATERPELNEPTPGDTILFGSYEQDNNSANGKETIEWLVLDVQGGKALVISKYALDCQPYNEDFEDITWETCTLRKWLNNEFLNTAFTESEKSKIATAYVAAEDNESYGTDAGNNTYDNLFLLNLNDVSGRYFDSESARRCKPTAYAVAKGAWESYGYCWWWLRSPGSYQNDAAYVYGSGNVYENGDVVDDYVDGVRPALWIDLNA